MYLINQALFTSALLIPARHAIKWLAAIAIVAGSPFVVHPQDQSPVEGVRDLVDPLTGNFSYSIPLLVVPGPNGEQFPITLDYYTDGIGVEQRSGEVGLGWSLDLGGVSRQVNGVPDDVCNKTRTVTRYTRVRNGSESNEVSDVDIISKNQVYGPIHFNQIDDQITSNWSIQNTNPPMMDLYSHRTDASSNKQLFQFPDYDDYYLRSAFISGNIHLFNFEYFNIFSQPRVLSSEMSHNAGSFPIPYGFNVYQSIFDDPTYRHATLKPAMILDLTTASNCPPPFDYSDLQPASTNTAGPLNSPLNFYPFPSEYESDHFVDHSQFIIGNNSSILHKSGRRVQYYTNQQVIAHLNGINPIPNFIDWKENTLVQRLNQDPNIIGSIIIYDDNGYIYNFSLPIIHHQSKSYQFDLDYDGLPSSEAILNESTSWWVDETVSDWSYPSEWKLTSITGPDFVDNGNSILDDSDKGYWIAIDYALWADSFADRQPLFGYQTDPIQHVDRSARLSEQYLINSGTPYALKGATSQYNSQIYYPNKVRTQTHSALFFYSLKDDDYSIDENKIPLLKLNNVYLFYNKDLINELLSSTVKPDLGDHPIDVYNFCAVENVYNINHVSSSNLHLKSIQGVAMKYDYHLAHRYNRNIRNPEYNDIFSHPIIWSSYSDQSFSLTLGYGHSENNQYSTELQDGKLTLLSVTKLGLNGLQSEPPYDFSYYNNYENNNYYYVDHKVDYSGLYKIDRNPNDYHKYRTAASSAHCHAWSLKSIYHPLGNVIDILYESDIYSRVGDPVSGSSEPTIYIPLLSGQKIADNRISAAYHSFSGIDNIIDDVITASDKATYISYSSRFPCLVSGCHDADQPGWAMPQCHILNRSNNTLLLESVNGSDFFRSAYFTPHANMPECGQTVYCQSNLTAVSFLKLVQDRLYGGGVRVKTINNNNLVQNIVLNNKVVYMYEDGLMTCQPGPIKSDGVNDPYNIRLGDPRVLNMVQPGIDRLNRFPKVLYKRITSSVVDNYNVTNAIKRYTYWNREPQYSYIQFSYKHLFPLASDGSHVLHQVLVCNEESSLCGQLLSEEDLDPNGVVKSKVKYNYDVIPVTAKLSENYCMYGTIPNMITSTTTRSIQRVTYSRNIIYRALKSVEFYRDGKSRILTYSNRDIYSGKYLKIDTEDDKSLVEEVNIIPAYHLYPNMGPSFDDVNKKNALSLSERILHLNGAGRKQEWTNEHLVRQYSADNLGYGSIVALGPWLESKQYTKLHDQNDWKYLGKTTLRNSRWMSLENKNMGQDYTSRKTDIDEIKIIAEVVNSNYASFTFSSFESHAIYGTGSDAKIGFDGEMLSSLGSGCITQEGLGTILPHSGNKYLHIPSGEYCSFNSRPSESFDDEETVNAGLMKGRTYRALVWVHRDSPNDARLRVMLTGSINAETIVRKDDPNALVVGDWIRLQARIVVPADLATTGEQGLSVSLVGGTDGPSYFDDIMVYPVDAQVQAACWDERTSLLTHALSAEGFVTKYTHDHTGAVIRVEQETERGYHTVSETEVGYAKPF